MKRCLSCGRGPDDRPYFGDVRCRPTYCQEQGINPRSPEHVEKRKRLRYEASKWPRPKGWRLHVFYNLGWHASLRGPDHASVSPPGFSSSGFVAYGVFCGQGDTVREALLAAARIGEAEARRVTKAAKVYADAAASI